MSDCILVIADSLGNPLGNREENLVQLEKMGYKLDENKEKLNMQKFSNIALAIYKSETHTQIVAHTFCGYPKIKGPRPDRYYFLYNVDGGGATTDLSNTLEKFSEKANEEIKKYGMEIKEEKTTLYPFRDITKVVKNDKIPPLKEDLLNGACECLNRKPSIQLEAHSIEKVIPYLINLYRKRKYCNFTIYLSPGILKESNVNIFINKNIEEIERSLDIEDIVGKLERIRDDVRQKDRMGAKKKIESLLNMAGG